MKILITGGHFTPAYSVIQKLKDDDVMVVGRKYAFEGDTNETLEYAVCRENNIKFEVLSTGRLQRKLTSKTLPSLFKFPKGVGSALKILRQFRPDVVVTFGGYIGLPVAIAASMLRIPVVLHEQTQKAGLSSRLISRLASVVCISFPSSKQYFKKNNVVVTGNPIREAFFQKHESVEFEKKKPFIYITGGSTGSHVINKTVGEIISKLASEYTVFHQVGGNTEFNDLKMLTEIKNALPEALSDKYIVRNFFTENEVAYLFQNAKLVISRSGVNTVLELIASHTPALLIPFPYGQRNEQKDNAQLFKEAGLGEVLFQENVTGESLSNAIHDIINNKKYALVKSEEEKYIFPNSSEKIIQQIYLYGRRKTDKREGSTSDKKENLTI